MRERLRAVPLFAGLDDGQLDRLATAATEFQAAAGQLLIERGAPGSGMFVLEDGRAVAEAPEGERELGPGDVFGERALVGNAAQRRGASRRVARSFRLSHPRRSCLSFIRAPNVRLASGHRPRSTDY